MTTNKIFGRAYDDLTQAVARAKKICRSCTQLQNSAKAALNIPKEKNGRGRPKGSKDSKPRDQKQSKLTPACRRLTSHHERHSEISGEQLSNDHLVEIPTAPSNLSSDLGVDGSGYTSEPSFSDSFFSHNDLTGPVEKFPVEESSSRAEAQHNTPACWILPLP